jgi:hypothetical protein
MKDVFEIQNWVSPEEINQIAEIASEWDRVEFRPDYGRWPGELIAIQSWHTWNDHDALGQLFKNRMTRLLGYNIKVVEVDYVELYLPWDIHSEGTRPEKGSAPWYTFVIPLESYPGSRTMIFDQTSDEYNDFYRYKQSNPKAKMPVDIKFWEDNLSHCWDEDREYLSLKYASRDWTAGDTLFFKRNLFHSSDNFHTRNIGPKKFLQILTDLA